MNKLINQVVENLRNGQVILTPTDTIWGLSCEATNVSAIERIYHIKRRPNDKKLILLFPNLEMLNEFTIDHSIDYSFLLKNETPSTFILNHNFKLPSCLISNLNTIAVRIPKNEFLIQIMTKLNGPIVSTSANLSSQPSPMKFSEIDQHVLDSVDVLISASYDSGTGQASSIFELKNGHWEPIR